MITSVVMNLSGTASYTDGSVDHFHGSSDANNNLVSVTGVEGYRAADNIHHDSGDWNDILSNMFVYLSWSIANFQINATAQSVRKTINDMVVSFAVKCTTDGDNSEEDLVGTSFEAMTTYQLGGRVSSVAADTEALLNELTRDAVVFQKFQNVVDAALESVELTIAP